MSHTPEPWVVVEPYHGCDGTPVNGGIFDTDDGAPGAMIGDFGSHIDALRAVAAVNFCHGVENEFMVGKTYKADRDRLRAQRDHAVDDLARLRPKYQRMLEALCACEDMLVKEGTARSWPAIAAARAAIADA